MKRCYLINLASVSSVSINIHELLQALSMFLLNQHTCLLESDSWNYPIMRRLFQIARDTLMELLTYARNTICSSGGSERKYSVFSMKVNSVNTGHIDFWNKVPRLNVSVELPLEL